MRLEEILKGYDYELLSGNLEHDIRGISNDSRNVEEGFIFVAEQGYRVDGHDYIKNAIEKGSKVIIIDREIESIQGDFSLIRVENSFDALAYILAVFNDRPWEKLHNIAITGTNGKTSTSYFLRSIFEANKDKTGIIGTMGAVIDGKNYDLDNTTPNAQVLNDIFLKMNDEGVDYSFMEVSSHALALKRVEYMTFERSIFTNLAKDHLDYHKTVEHYFESKALLFDSDKTRGASIINIDDEYGQELASRIRGELVTYSTKDSGADLFADELELGLDYASFRLNAGDRSIGVRLNIPGEFSIYNALSAAACAYSYGLDLETIRDGLEAVEGVKGRFEVVPTGSDYTVIIDFAHTAEGLEKVLEVIDQFVQGRKIVVFGAGGNRDRTKRPEMGEVVARHADLSIVTSDNPRNEEPEAIIDDILVGTRKISDNYVKIIDRVEAIEYALEIAGPGDIILLAGKGHETYTIIGDETIACDERAIVLDYLNRKKK